MSDWPNLFIPGVAKAGTTTLHDLLGKHPEIFMCREKEPHFFSQIEPTKKLKVFFKHIESRDEYLSLFATPEDIRWKGEASTSYFWDTRAITRICQVSSEARFLILLRDPVERAYSHYLNDVSEGVERRSFWEALQRERATPREQLGWGRTRLYLDNGFYAPRLERILGMVPESRLRILVFEEFVRAIPSNLTEIFDFLAVDSAPAAQIVVDTKNPYTKPRALWTARVMGSEVFRRLGRVLVFPRLRPIVRHLFLQQGKKPEMDDTCRSFLESLYREDCRECENLLGRKLPWSPLSKHP